jgi:hypothetical protein
VWVPFAAALAAVLAVAAPAAAAPGDALPTLDQVTASGSEWRFETARGAIRVWIPARYDAATAATIVFVHGYHLDLDAVWRDCHLPQQFALSGLNAMFLAAAAPSGRSEAIVWPSATALLAAVAAHTDVAMPTQRLVAIGHSGAYRTLEAWLADTRLDTVVLLDAAYTAEGYKPWLRADPRHRLINIAHETGRTSDRLHRQLPATTYVDDLAGGLPDARIVYARTDLGHWRMLDGGVALPLALRAIDVGKVDAAPLHLPLGVPKHGRPRTSSR